jgi:signal transduction histidine kinase
VSHDISSDRLFEPWREHALTSGLKSAIALPLIVREETIGSLAIYAPEPDAFDSDEVNLLAELAQDLSFGISIIRARAEQQVAHEALRLNQARLQALIQLNQMSDLSLKEIKDYVLEESVRLTGSTIGYIAFASNDGAALEIKTWSKTVMERCAVHDRPMVFPMDKVGLWGDAARQRKPVIINDYAAPHPRKKGLPDGHVDIVRHMAVPLLDDRGELVALAGVANKLSDYDESDVTQLTLLLQAMWKYIQRRKSEEELRIYRDHLEELVRARTAELQQINDRLYREATEKERLCRHLEDKTRELDSFVHTASHDLKAPLVILGGYTDRIKKNYGGLLDGRGLHYLDLLKDSVRRMEALIRDLLELSRAGRVAGDMGPVNVEKMLDDINQSMAPLLREKNITLTIKKPIPWALGDHGRIAQIFENLLTNAIKFMGAQPAASIEIGSADAPKDKCVYYVRDNGIGIDPAHREIIFKEFHRLKEIETDGTGIGLAIVKKIIDHYNGNIWIESSPGKGSTFYVELPGCDQTGDTKTVLS